VHRPSTHIRQVGADLSVEKLYTLVSHVHLPVSLGRPEPAGSTAARPVVVGAAPTLPGAPGSGCPSSPGSRRWRSPPGRSRTPAISVTVTQEFLHSSSRSSRSTCGGATCGLRQRITMHFTPTPAHGSTWSKCSAGSSPVKPSAAAPHLHRRPGSRDRALHRPLERACAAVHLGQGRRHHPRQGNPREEPKDNTTSETHH
jgi:hypothetical protein